MLNARDFKIGSRLISTTTGALGLMIAFVVIALIGLGKVGEKAQLIAVDNAATLDVIAEMREAVEGASMRARNAMLYEESARQRQEEKEMTAALARYRESEQHILGRNLSASMRDAVSKLPAAQSRSERALQRLFTLVASGNRPAIEAHFESYLAPALEDWQKRLNTLVYLQRQANDEALAQIAAIREEARIILFGLIIFAVLVMVPSGIWVTRGITRPLGQAVNIAGAVAAGKFDNPIETGGHDEPAHLLQSLARMQDDLCARTASERRVAAEVLRIKVALDVGSNCVTLVDGQGRVIYANAAMLEMLRVAEADLRAAVPEFQAHMLNAGDFPVARLHQDLATDRLCQLAHPRRTEIEIGRRVFALVITPVIDAAGQRLSTVIEWLDRTGEIAIEREVAAIVEAAANGDFALRIALTDKRGFFLQLSTAINYMLETNSQALQAVGAMLARLAEGDLTEKIETAYQGDLERVRNDANGTIDHLREIVISIKQASDAINTAALEIAQGNQDLSARTEHQASSLQQTASSMEELTSTVLQNASTAQRAHGLAEDARSVAEVGGEVVGQVVVTMSAIQQSSNRIADIIGVIDGIAFQTNILALNAAVEAARAGEQGRGFAVVASEVRNLAQRSAAAAKEIKGLIDDSVSKVAAGNKLVEQAGGTMQNVVSSVQTLARLMADISHASREQSSGIEQVGQAITQMDEVTQQNAARVEEAAAAAESLQEQAESLVSLVSVFRLAQTGQAGWGVVHEHLPAPGTQAARGGAAAMRLAHAPEWSAPQALTGELEPRAESIHPALPAALSAEDDDWAEF
ncbi:MAG: methyl-accepting chemotaxis protein [Azonexus sp.]